MFDTIMFDKYLVNRLRGTGLIVVPGGHALSVVPVFITNSLPHNLHIRFWEGSSKALK